MGAERKKVDPQRQTLPLPDPSRDNGRDDGWRGLLVIAPGTVHRGLFGPSLLHQTICDVAQHQQCRHQNRSHQSRAAEHGGSANGSPHFRLRVFDKEGSILRFGAWSPCWRRGGLRGALRARPPGGHLGGHRGGSPSGGTRLRHCSFGEESHRRNEDHQKLLDPLQRLLRGEVHRRNEGSGGRQRENTQRERMRGRATQSLSRDAAHHISPRIVAAFDSLPLTLHHHTIWFRTKRRSSLSSPHPMDQRAETKRTCCCESGGSRCSAAVELKVDGER